MNVVLYVPSGMLRMTYEDAVGYIREHYDYKNIKKWSDNLHEYEDYQDEHGNTLAQIQKGK